MCLFSDMSEKMVGFRVVEQKCFQKIASFFDSITYEEIIQTGYANSNVTIFGTIVIAWVEVNWILKYDKFLFL